MTLKEYVFEPCGVVKGVVKIPSRQPAFKPPPEPMPSKHDHLQMHGGTYRVRIGIPKDLRWAFGGKSFFIQPLGTADLNEANRLKGACVTRFRTEINLAKRPGDPNLRDVRMLRRQWERGSDDEAADALAEAVARADQLEATDGADAGDRFFKMATGQLSP